MSNCRWLVVSPLTAAVVGSLVLLVSCVISPRNEFVYSYETMLVGKSYAETVEKWPGSKEIVSSASTPTKVIKVNVAERCNLYYTVDNDKITRASDDQGKDCWKVN